MRRLLARQEDGQASVEYAVLAVFISIAAITLMQTLGVQVVGLFNSIAGSF
jgi:Flp pilus assembly pilin Flp